jgi:hypothetical protein
MKGHLALDGLQGVAMVGAAVVMDQEDSTARAGLLGIGLFELGASLLTKTRQ